MIPSKKKKVHQRVHHYTLSTTFSLTSSFRQGLPESVGTMDSRNDGGLLDIGSSVTRIQGDKYPLGPIQRSRSPSTSCMS